MADLNAQEDREVLEGQASPHKLQGSSRGRTDSGDIGEKHVNSHRVRVHYKVTASSLDCSSHCREKHAGSIGNDRVGGVTFTAIESNGERELEIRAWQAKWTCGACSKRCGRMGGARDRGGVCHRERTGSRN